MGRLGAARSAPSVPELSRSGAPRGSPPRRRRALTRTEPCRSSATSRTAEWTSSGLTTTGTSKTFKAAPRPRERRRSLGYKGSGQKGSAPTVDAGGGASRFGGVVYRYADKYNGNIDEYSPIFTPEDRLAAGDVYEPGFVGLAVWAVGFVSLLGVGGFAIYSTSALSG